MKPVNVDLADFPWESPAGFRDVSVGLYADLTVGSGLMLRDQTLEIGSQGDFFLRSLAGINYGVAGGFLSVMLRDGFGNFMMDDFCFLETLFSEAIGGYGPLYANQVRYPAGSQVRFDLREFTSQGAGSARLFFRGVRRVACNV
ncbi:hypothetical protein EPO44_10185 [bacterium]|nr:MAG: hypothetical protein EPO44_10185 [bacterium]